MSWRTCARSNRVNNTDAYLTPGCPSTAAIEAAWNIGVPMEAHPGGVDAERDAGVHRFSVSAREAEQHALRQSRGAARVHEDDRVVLVGLGRDQVPGGDQALVIGVVRPSPPSM